MKIHLKIPQGLKKHFEEEIKLAWSTSKKGELKVAWRHFERAHILGQAWPIEHTKAHWHMIIFAFKIKNTKEIIGQIPRLIIGGVKSFVGNIPIGNTGGADVPPLKPMEIPEDLLIILNKYKSS